MLTDAELADLVEFLEALSDGALRAVGRQITVRLADAARA